MIYVADPELEISAHIGVDKKSSKTTSTITIQGFHEEVIEATIKALTSLCIDQNKRNLLDGCQVEKAEKGSIVIHLKLDDNAARERFKKSIQDGSMKILLGNILRASGVHIGEMHINYTYSEDGVSVTVDKSSQPQGIS